MNAFNSFERQQGFVPSGLGSFMNIASMSSAILGARRTFLSYQPTPIDNSSIELSPELQRLIEMLARNNHELWAKRRMEEGWRYGPKRDDVKKETPVLVPYDQLPDSEKQYDRDNARETLKTIIAMGGKVEAPTSTSG